MKIVSALFLTITVTTGLALSEPAWPAVESMTGAAFKSCNKVLCYRLDAEVIGKSYFSRYFIGRDLKLKIVDKKSRRVISEWVSPHGMFDPRINRWILSEAQRSSDADAVAAAVAPPRDLYFYPATFSYSYFRAQR